jgi:co-chaperonin GroES (HSP10)
MALHLENQDIKKFILIGDRVLIKPKSVTDRTKGGLLLPPGIQEKENLQSGYVVKVGPGYPIPAIVDTDEPWKNKPGQHVNYVPLQPQEGDLAIYLQNNSWEIQFNNEKYVILPQSAILMLIRDDSLFE